MELAFLSLVFSGVAALLTGMMLTRFHWRSDIPPYGFRTSFLHVSFHPEIYAQAHAPLKTIRGLNLAGAILLVGAIGVVSYEIVRTTVR